LDKPGIGGLFEKPATRRNDIKLCVRRSIVFKVQDQFWQHGIKQFT
jgi:hypothetical protein